MKECAVNRERAVIANNQVAEVAEPCEGAFDFPAPSVASQRSSVLGHGFASIPAMRRDQFDPALSQPLSQRVTVVTTIGDQAQRFLPRPPRVSSAAYADRRERRFRESRFVRGCRTKELTRSRELGKPERGEVSVRQSDFQRGSVREVPWSIGATRRLRGVLRNDAALAELSISGGSSLPLFPDHRPKSTSEPFSPFLEHARGFASPEIADPSAEIFR
jgi:hypothetical protein